MSTTQEGATRSADAVTTPMVKAELAELRRYTRRWFLIGCVPLCVGVYGTLIAVLVSLVAR